MFLTSPRFAGLHVSYHEGASSTRASGGCGRRGEGLLRICYLSISSRRMLLFAGLFQSTSFSKLTLPSCPSTLPFLYNFFFILSTAAELLDQASPSVSPVFRRVAERALAGPGRRVVVGSYFFAARLCTLPSLGCHPSRRAEILPLVGGGMSCRHGCLEE